MMKKYLAATALLLAVGSQAAYASPNYCFETSNSGVVSSLHQKGVDAHVLNFGEFQGVNKASDIYQTLLQNCPNIGNDDQLNNNELVIITGQKKGLWFSANLRPQLSGLLASMQNSIKNGDVDGALQIASNNIQSQQYVPPQAQYQQPQPQYQQQYIPPQQTVTTTTVTHHSGIGFLGWFGILLMLAAFYWVIRAMFFSTTTVVETDSSCSSCDSHSTHSAPRSQSTYSAPPRRTTTTYPATFGYGGAQYPGCWYNGNWGFYGPGGFMPWGYYNNGAFIAGEAAMLTGLILGESLAASAAMSSDYGWTDTTTTTTSSYDNGSSYVGGDITDNSSNYQRPDVGGDISDNSSNYQQDAGGDLDDNRGSSSNNDSGGDIEDNSSSNYSSGGDSGGDFGGSSDSGSSDSGGGDF